MERRESCLLRSQLQLLAEALREPVRSFTLLLVLTGLRVGELLVLRWGNVDVKARLLRVVETVFDGHFDKPKTKRGMRTIPIGAETAEIRTVLVQPRLMPKPDICQERSDAIRPMESLAQAPEACRKEVRPFRCYLASSEAQPRDDA
jgi:hypothetical protein